MCPKDEILSAYFDSEIEEPWCSEIKAHLETCGGCQTRLVSFNVLREKIVNEPVQIEDAGGRVWSRVSSTLAGWNYREIERSSASAGSFWQRQVRIPMPVLAAAMGLFFVMVASLFFFIGKNDTQSLMTASSADGVQNVQVYYSLENAELLRRILTETDFREEVIIELPSDNDFTIIGEPAVRRVVNTRGR